MRSGQSLFLAVVVACGLSGCLPSEPVGSRHAERKIDGRFEMSNGLCKGETVTRVRVYERGNQENPDPSLLRWDAIPSAGLVPPNVVVLGDDGSFGLKPTLSLRGDLPDPMVVITTTSEREFFAVVKLSQFDEAEEGTWRMGDESVSLSAVTDPSCPK